MKEIYVVSAPTIAAVFRKDARIVAYALHRKYTGTRLVIAGETKDQVVFPVNEVILWAAVHLPRSVNTRTVAELRWRSFPVPAPRERVR